MRVIDYRDAGTGRPRITSEPDGWEPGPDPARAELVAGHRGALDIIRLEAGTHVPMHSVPMPSVCLMLQGAGWLRVAGAGEITYEAGDVIVFPPGLDHEWYDLTQTTVIAVVEDPDLA